MRRRSWRALGAAGWQGLRILRGRVSGSPALVSASLYPTHRCNLRCVYCSSPYLRTAELSTAQWEGVLRQLRHLGCRRVAFLGGEPLVRADVPYLVGTARRLGMGVALTSNGILVPALIDGLNALDTLILSLDAAGPANDAVRGAGTFRAVEDAIVAAKRARIPVKINAVLSASTLGALDDLLAFVGRHDLHVTVNVMRSGAPDLWHEARTIKPADGEVARVLERLADLARTNPRLLFSDTTYRYAARWRDYGRDRLEGDEVAPDDARIRHGPRCHAGRHFLVVNPDGTTFPCPLTVGRVRGGNVITDGVAAAWRSLHEHQCVACYSPCLVEQNYLFSLHGRVVWTVLTRHLRRFA